MNWITKPFSTAEDHVLTSRLFLKLLAIIYFVAFASLSIQITALAGINGILPFEQLLSGLYGYYGWGAVWQMPNIFWINASDLVLQGAAWAGMLFSATLLLGFRERLSLIMLFILYLSLLYAGQIFMNFQWDYLLLESGFLAIFLVGGPNRLTIFLFHWLLFRLRFMSGLSKVVSGDPSWSGFTALNYYFETQPLPHIGAWYAHQLPEWLLQTGVVLTLFVELVVPFFIFLPRRFRITAATITILVQLAIIATSNHNWINILTIVLCLFLLDDRIVGKIMPGGKKERRVFAGSDRSRAKNPPVFLPVSAAILILSASLPSIYIMAGGKNLHPAIGEWSRIVRTYGIGQAYHVFPTMQTERMELEIEGSSDGIHWQRYLFKYKPGPLERQPAFVVPHQPRLDWLIWFVPAKHHDTAEWFIPFIRSLQFNPREVSKLLEHNPFPQGARYLRIQAYRYHFTTPAERAQSGNWWKAEYIGEFPDVPPRRP